MNEAFESYDYLNVTVERDLCSQYMDGYQSMGWQLDPNLSQETAGSKTTIHMKRSRNILNKMELTRLQRHYEACMQEIIALEASRQSIPTMVAIGMGVVGCAFMAGGTMVVTLAEPPIYWLMVLLAIPGIALWALAYPAYKAIQRRRTSRVLPLIDAKYDEAYEVCAKAQQLLLQ